MGGKTAIAAGFVMGGLAGVAVLAAVLALAPDVSAPQPTRAPITLAPSGSASPGPSTSPGSPATAPSPSATAPSPSATAPSPSATAGPPASGASPSASAGPPASGASPSAWGALALPVHFWVDADGVVRNGALGGIVPDIMVRGLERIMPGVTVTP